VPAHVAIVMDGNGRWATQRGLPRTEGHGAGEEALWDTVKGAVEVGVKWLTVYAFSTENWSRPPAEVLYLMNFNRGLLRRRRDELNTMNVRIRFIGRRDWRVPRSVLKEIEISEELTRTNTGTTLTIAFNYGGRKEVVDAVRQLAREVQAGTLKPSKIDDDAIAARLYASDMPDPDLLIRTSGEMRTRSCGSRRCSGPTSTASCCSKRSETSKSVNAGSVAWPKTPRLTRARTTRGRTRSCNPRRPSRPR
jgi:undecaprenyl diphosphate synthase